MSTAPARRCRPALVGAAASAITALVACSSGGGQPARAAGSTDPAPGTASAHIGQLDLTGGYIPQPASPDVAAAYFTVVNKSGQADTLLKVSTDVSSHVMAMNETDNGSSGSMTDLPKVVVPAHGTFRFSPGHAHLMVEQPSRALRQGDHVRMTITFARAGTVTISIPVVSLSGPSAAPAMPSMSGMSMTG